MGRFLRRVFRYAFHAATVLSTLALVACLVLWPLSYRRGVHVEYERPTGCVSVGSGLGRCGIAEQNFRLRGPGWHWDVEPTAGGPAGWSYAERWHASIDADPARGYYSAEYHLRGILVMRTSRSAPGVLGSRFHSFALLVPYSYLTLLSALLPALWLHRYFRRRRASLARPGFPIEPPPPPLPPTAAAR